jgi:hypothetical protein
MTAGCRTPLTVLAVTSVLFLGVVAAQQVPLPLAPRPERGAGVTPAFEGWYENPDGTFTLVFGYLNRNHREALDIPTGPLNRVEPGPPDQGQPTYFLPVGLKEPRQLGVFTITVPKDFGNKKITWTLTANGETNTVPGRLHPDYVITPFGEPAQGDTPPEVRFTPDGETHSGPPRRVNASFTATPGVPLTLSVWAGKKPLQVKTRGDQSKLTLRWSKYRGPGSVSFTVPETSVSSVNGNSSTDVVFGVLGEYVLRLEASTSSDRGSNQCCRTSALVKVSVM